ncbi:hypothetical protein LZ32DRAFT_658679 [Colletotrichum eremochloae]|nr:hypothetical protein LZ32DRAFT_658679 [Colletotrichum eremochloae]
MNSTKIVTSTRRHNATRTTFIRKTSTAVVVVLASSNPATVSTQRAAPVNSPSPTAPRYSNTTMVVHRPHVAPVKPSAQPAAQPPAQPLAQPPAQPAAQPPIQPPPITPSKPSTVVTAAGDSVKVSLNLAGALLFVLAFF